MVVERDLCEDGGGGGVEKWLEIACPVLQVVLKVGRTPWLKSWWVEWSGGWSVAEFGRVEPVLVLLFLLIGAIGGLP